MTDPNTTTNEAPEQWEQYGSILRQTPGPVLARERSAEMLSAIHASIDSPARPGWRSRWVLIPAASIVTIVLVLFLANISAPKEAPEMKAGVPAVVKETGERPRQIRRPSRNRLPAPSIPATPYPTAVDSSLLPKPVPVPPLVDPVGPGGSRAPRGSGYRGTPAPAHAPTPGS